MEPAKTTVINEGQIEKQKWMNGSKEQNGYEIDCRPCLFSVLSVLSSS